MVDDLEAVLRVYLRQLGLSFAWSAVVLAGLWLAYWSGNTPFDGRLAVIVVVLIFAVQMWLAGAHRKSVGRIVEVADVSDLSRAPSRELFVTTLDRKVILAWLVSFMEADRDMQVSEHRAHVYDFRRKHEPRKAKARVTVDQDDSGTYVRIVGRIPWWLGVDGGRTLKLVVEVSGYLQNGFNKSLQGAESHRQVAG